METENKEKQVLTVRGKKGRLILQIERKRQEQELIDDRKEKNDRQKKFLNIDSHIVQSNELAGLTG